MKYGYIRVSTKKQASEGNSLESQKQAVIAAGAEQVFSDTISGSQGDRPALNRLLELIRPGDWILITSLDRLGRSINQANDLISNLIDNDITIYVLNIGILDNSSIGVLLRNVLLAFAQFERDIIKERMAEGKAIARKRKDYREGRPKKFSEEQINLALHLLETRTYKQVEKLTGISKSTLIRAKRAKLQDGYK